MRIQTNGIQAFLLAFSSCSLLEVFCLFLTLVLESGHLRIAIKLWMHAVYE